jgi:galactokinase
LLFDSNVPLGSGLSSSASLEMAAGMALLQAAGTMIDRYKLAKIGQHAEHTFIGTPCGIMDQAISVLGEQGQALLLDCRDGATRNIPFNDPAIRLLVCNTEVKHELNDGGYSLRRDQCYAAAKVLGVPMLRDVSVEQVKQAESDGVLRGKELMRARHVVGEIDRTLRAVAAMEEGDLKTFGAMMIGSHSSLRDDYEVSCDELDLIVDTAITLEGVYGARMTGGGFGGCAIVLARADQADAITETIQTTFNNKFGHVPPVYITTASQGASIVE